MRYDKPWACYLEGGESNLRPVEVLPTHYYNILDEVGTEVVPSFGTVLVVRKKRNVELSDDLTDEDFEVFRRFGSGVHNRVKRTSPAITRFSEEHATNYCRKLIADTDISKSCAKVGSNAQALVDSCSIDLKVKRFPFCFFVAVAVVSFCDTF